MNIFIVFKLQVHYIIIMMIITLQVQLQHITIIITITLHYNHVQMTRNHMALSIDDNDDLK